MPESLSVTVDSFEGVAVLRLRGGLVFGQKLEAVGETVSRLKREGHERLVLDLTDVEPTDSSGISALLGVRRAMGGNIILFRPSDRLRSALAVTRVSFLFDMVDDEAQLARRIAGSHDNPDADAGREGGKT